MGNKAGRSLRLRKRKEMDLVFRQGRRLSDEAITVLAIGNGLGVSRVAVAVSAAHGGAVRRNRLKRLCREAFRASRPELPGGWDFVIMPRKGQDSSVQQLRASILSLGRRLTEGGETKGRRP